MGEDEGDGPAVNGAGIGAAIGSGTAWPSHGDCEPRSVWVRAYAPAPGSVCGVTIRASAASASAAGIRSSGSFSSIAWSTGARAPARTGGVGPP